MYRRRRFFYLLATCAAILAILVFAYGAFGSGDAIGSLRERVSSGNKPVARKTPPRGPSLGPLPNILFVTIDSLRGDYLGVNGSQKTKTPYLDALARQGANFTLAFTTFSQTNPAHASLFTGSYPATHKLLHHCVDRISDSAVTLAELLWQYGYNTKAIHSWPCFEGSFGFDRGYDSFQGVYVKVPGETNFDRSVDGRADVTTDAVLKWASQAPASPYFLWVHYMDPHYPYTPPAPFDTMYDPGCQDCLDGSWESMDKIAKLYPSREADIRHVAAMYAGEVSFTDREIGRLLAGLGKAGLLDNTLVILTADHGEALSENGYWFHPWILFNTVIRVPLIVTYPPGIPAGTNVDKVVSTVDVMPTILELAGIPLPAQTDGQSLWPLIRGTEKGDGRTAIAETPDERFFAVMTNEWKMIRDFKSDESLLFKTKADPGETNDLAASNARQVAAMEQVLKAWMASHGVSLPASVR